MTDRFARLEALFAEAVELPAAARGAWLAALDVEEPLRAELAAMLRHDGDAADLTERIGGALAAAEPSAADGQRLGPYRLLRELGSGGMGTVFLAERADEAFERQVAIKLIRGVATAQAAQQLRNERQVLAGLEHPRIARLLDGGQTPSGQPYLVMEFVAGEALTTAARRLRLPMRRRAALVRDIALAVSYAHQRLVIHRDIKPGNVLLREDGRPMLLDFGIAKLLSEDGNGAARAQTLPWFTPAYASPEQRRGEPVSTATDIYALGLLLYELLTDATPPPVEAGSLPEPSRRLHGSRRRAVRGDLDRIVQRATAAEPERRYPSALALAEDIERYLDGRPVRAARDSLGYRMRKFVWRHPLGVGAGLAVVLALSLLSLRLAAERDRALRAEAIALQRSDDAAAVTAFLTDLFHETDPVLGRRRQITALELIDRGIAKLHERDDLGAPERVRLLRTLGSIYANMGQPVKATQALELAGARATEAGLPAAEQSGIWLALGSAYDDRGDHADSARAFARAASVLDWAGDPAGAALARAQYGWALGKQREIEQALGVLGEARAQIDLLRGPGSLDATRAQVWHGDVLMNAGSLEEARALVDPAIARMRSELAADDLELLGALGTQAELWRQLGDDAGAERLFLEMLEHRRRLTEHDSVAVAFVHSELGSVYADRGDTRRATEQMEMALAISERALGAGDPSLAIDHNNLSAMYELQQDYARAEPHMRKALAAVLARPDGQLAYITQFRQNLGRLLLLAGRPEESLTLLQLPIPDGEGPYFVREKIRQAAHLAEWHRRYGDARRIEPLLAEAEALLPEMGDAGAIRKAQILRTRGLALLAQRRPEQARPILAEARGLAIAARDATFVLVGEIELDLAELERGAGRREAARQRWESARAILEPVLAEAAPDRERLRRAATRL